MKETFKIKAYAKINLCLDVVNKRDDGKHNLISIMQSILLYDRLEIKKINKEGYLKIVNNLYHLPNDERNIVFKAIQSLIEKYPDKINSGLFVNLKKTIPVAAGLGGGSSDCAAALKALNIMFNLDMGNDELILIGKSLGADVPFFIKEGTLKAEGIGEILTNVSAMPNCYFLLLRPPIIVSTADIFKKFDFSKIINRPDVEKMIYCLSSKDLDGICSCFANVLETVTIAEYPIIASLKELLMENGALGSLMSGSGPTVFGCFKSKRLAIKAMNIIKAKHPTINEYFIVKNYCKL